LAEAALSDGHTVAGTVRNDADKQKFEVSEKSLAQNLGQPSLIGIGI
jgi:hypothetical protein